MLIAMDNWLKIETSRSMHTIITHLLMVQIKRAPRFNSRKHRHTQFHDRFAQSINFWTNIEKKKKNLMQLQFQSINILLAAAGQPSIFLFYYKNRTNFICIYFLSFRNGSTTMTSCTFYLFVIQTFEENINFYLSPLNSIPIQYLNNNNFRKWFTFFFRWNYSKVATNCRAWMKYRYIIIYKSIQNLFVQRTFVIEQIILLLLHQLI